MTTATPPTAPEGPLASLTPAERALYWSPVPSADREAVRATVARRYEAAAPPEAEPPEPEQAAEAQAEQDAMADTWRALAEAVGEADAVPTVRAAQAALAEVRDADVRARLEAAGNDPAVIRALASRAHPAALASVAAARARLDATLADPALVRRRLDGDPGLAVELALLYAVAHGRPEAPRDARTLPIIAVTRDTLTGPARGRRLA